MTKEQWTEEKIACLFEQPLNDLLFEAQVMHRQHFKANEIELCTLLSIKTGTCPEDCAYCPQSGHYQTDVEAEKLLDISIVKHHAERAKANGATRFCMGAAWRNPPARQFPKIIEMIKTVKALGLETCMTLGMLSDEQSRELQAAGLDYYNHNLDSSPEYYKKIITTRTYQDRLNTLQRVRNAGIHVCCGGILGMGETRQDRIGLLLQLASLPEPPASIPINRLIPIKGTPLEQAPLIDNFEFIRTVAITRIMMPQSVIRLSAGRETMSDEMHALCFLAGANSIFYGDKLLVTNNPETDKDMSLINKLGMTPRTQNAVSC